MDLDTVCMTLHKEPSAIPKFHTLFLTPFATLKPEIKVIGS